MCRARAGARRRQACSSCRPTRRRSGRARTRSRPIGRSADASAGLSGRRRRRVCARRSAAPIGLDPDRIVCGAGSDDLLNLLADAYLADGDEAIHTTHGFLVYPIATLGTGRQPVVAAEKNLHGRRRRDPGGAERADQDRVPGQSRTIRPAPMCRSTRSSGCTAGCRRRAARARRRLCGICAAQRLRIRHRAGRAPPTTW